MTNVRREAVLLPFTSGYRCPHGNHDVNGAANSLHMNGTAADLKSMDYEWTEAEFNRLREAAELTNPHESFNWDEYPNDRHYHVSWR